MEGWQLFVAIGAAVVSVISLLGRLLDKSLSIREHEEYKSQEQQKAVLRDRIVDLLEKRVMEIEHSRPTVGELSARLDARLNGK